MATPNQDPVETTVLDTGLQGTPLVVTKFTEFRDGKLQEEPLLTNGRELRLVVTANADQPDVYAVKLIMAKGKRYFSMSSPTWLEFTGLTTGGSASLSVDGDSNELVFRIR